MQKFKTHCQTKDQLVITEDLKNILTQTEQDQKDPSNQNATVQCSYSQANELKLTDYQSSNDFVGLFIVVLARLQKAQMPSAKLLLREMNKNKRSKTSKSTTIR